MGICTSILFNFLERERQREREEEENTNKWVHVNVYVYCLTNVMERECGIERERESVCGRERGKY